MFDKDQDVHYVDKKSSSCIMFSETLSALVQSQQMLDSVIPGQLPINLGWQSAGIANNHL
jgi:hypothetical protein